MGSAAAGDYSPARQVDTLRGIPAYLTDIQTTTHHLSEMATPRTTADHRDSPGSQMNHLNLLVIDEQVFAHRVPRDLQ